MTFHRPVWLLPLILSACAALPLPKAAPICDGHQRRPANPYGSILTPSAAQGAATGPAQANAPAGFASCP